MPLRLCSILGTLLLALAVATPVLAQGTEATGTDGDNAAAETRAKKRKARAKKKAAEEAAVEKSDTQAATKDDATTEKQAKRSKKKGKGKKKEAEAEEEKTKAEGESDEDKAASATAASAEAAPPEPDSWEAPPEDEEKPPAAPVAKRADDKPDHGGKPISAGLILGWGFETDRRSASFSGDPYGLGAGVRGGYSFDFNLYAGVYFMYYLGSSVTGSSQYVNNPTITTNANYMQFGAEVGYDWWVGPLVVRPSVQLGMAMAFHDVPNVISPINDFVFAPGLTVVHPWDDYFIGGDLRENVVTGDGTSALLLAGTFGMRF